MVARIVEALGAVSLVAGSWLLAPWLGLMVLGAALIAGANASEREPS